MIKNIAHICLRVSDLDRSQHFYCDLLGLEHSFDFTREDGSRFGTYLHAGGRNFIELFTAEITPPGARQSMAHFCLEVADVKQAAAELRSKGVEITDPKLGEDQSWQAWLKDPDGNDIELHSYTPESRQAPALR